MVTTTSVPDGVTESTLRIGTPRTRTPLPSQIEMVRGNFAASVFWSSPSNITSAAAMTRATMTAGAMIFLVMSATRLRDRGEVLDVGVEPRTVAEGVGEHPVERRHQ